KGVSLHVDRTRLPAPDDGTYYHADLIGLAAVDPEGRPVGEVVGVYNHGAGDLLEVRLAGTAKTELVAFTDTFVPEVGLKARRVVVQLDADTGVRPSGSDTNSAT